MKMNLLDQYEDLRSYLQHKEYCKGQKQMDKNCECGLSFKAVKLWINIHNIEMGKSSDYAPIED